MLSFVVVSGMASKSREGGWRVSRKEVFFIGLGGSIGKLSGGKDQEGDEERLQLFGRDDANKELIRLVWQKVMVDLDGLVLVGLDLSWTSLLRGVWSFCGDTEEVTWKGLWAGWMAVKGCNCLGFGRKELNASNCSFLEDRVGNVVSFVIVVQEHLVGSAALVFYFLLWND